MQAVGRVIRDSSIMAINLLVRQSPCQAIYLSVTLSPGQHNTGLRPGVLDWYGHGDG